MELTAALRILQAATDGVPVAPHVAGRLAAFVRGDAHALAALGAKLSPAQLRGAMMLPDPLPVPPTLRSLPLESLLTAERRLLLFAALDSDLPLPELIDAAGVEPEVLLFGPLRAILQGDNGRARFARESERAQVLQESDANEAGPAHAALARAHQRQGHAAAAAAHLVAAHPRRLPTLSTALIARAEALLTRGRLGEAHALARVITEAGGDIAARAWSIAGRSALWAGATADARAAFAGVGHSSAWGRRARDISGLLDLIDGGPRGVHYTVQETTHIFQTLETAAPNATEARLLRSLGAVFTTVYDDPVHADALHARALLGAAPANGSEWTPLASAHLTVAKLTASIFAEDYDEAAALLASAAPRSPLALAGGGIVADYAHVCIGHAAGVDERLAAAYRSITGDSRLRFSPELAAAMFPKQSTLLARAASGFHPGIRVDDAKSPGPPDPAAPLSARQAEVLTLMLRGLSNRDIAAQLSVSPRTVEVHATQILRKYEVRSRTALLALHAGAAVPPLGHENDRPLS